MKRWLRQTHGPLFELFRHFLGRFFDSDLITATEHTPTALVGTLSVVMQWMFLFIQPLKMKYEHFSRLPVPGPYREALRADELWLITLMMAAMGLLTAIKWQSLFPSLRDYRALASLPVRPGQLFLAKLLALIAVSAAAILALNLLPGASFPAVTAGHWAFRPSLGVRAWAHFAACAAGGYFFFFALSALEGVLLNALRPAAFRRVAASLQGVLAAAMLLLLVLSFSIQQQVAHAAIEPRFARFLPPAWFLGLYETLAGNPDAAMHRLARLGLTALAAAGLLTLAAYAVSYRRHRTLMVEGAPARGSHRAWPARVLEWFMPNPREQAVVSFVGKTLSTSGQHRMVLAGYCGFGLAVFVTAMLGIGKLYDPAKTVTASFVYAHLILLVSVLIGLRHLFSIPIELGANWMFRTTEREGRRDWMRALDRLLLWGGAAGMLVMPLPLEIRLLGWRALAEALLFALAAMCCYEAAFSSWDKLPFTCSYLPGKTPAWIVALRLLGLLIALPLASSALLACLYSPLAYGAALAILSLAWLRARALRRETWGEAALRYEDLPDPAIHGLGLLQ